MGIYIDGTKLTNRNCNIKMVASYRDSDRETKKVEKKQYTNKGNINLQKTATLDISKSGYASLAYDSKPGVVSGKTADTKFVVKLLRERKSTVRAHDLR